MYIYIYIYVYIYRIYSCISRIVQLTFFYKISRVDLYMGNVFHALLHNGLLGPNMYVINI